MSTPEQGARCEIRLLGALDARWSAWFAGLDVSCAAPGETILTGRLRDQAELHGVFVRVRDLGLPLLAVRRLECDPLGAGAPAPPGPAGARMTRTKGDRTRATIRSRSSSAAGRTPRAGATPARSTRS